MLVTAFAAPANANGNQNENEKSYSGTITALDAKDNIVKVRGYFFNKSFVLANDSTLTEYGKNKTSLADFRPGQKVAVRYTDASGVLVADRLTVEPMRFSGTVQGIDMNKHTLTIHRRGMDRTFTLADNCQVLGNDNKKENLDNVKWGDYVTVVYELPGDQRVARQIDLPGKVYTGSITAIDLNDHSINAGNDRKFYLANDCVIIANGKTNGRLNDLRTGQSYELNYETIGGVNVVDRIAPAEKSAKTEESSRTAQYLPPQ